MDYFVGEIRLFPYNRIPADWKPCNGPTMQVQQYAALYSLISFTYGGDGKTTFNLPNLNGRAILGYTSGIRTGTVYTMGQVGGTETVILNTTQLPTHTHTMEANNTYDSGGANTHYIGNPNVQTSATQTSKNSANANLYVTPTGSTPLVAMAPVITDAGSSAAHENRGPFLAMNYCIAVSGLYPPRP
jgi:microcystin-dependent protein